MNGTKRFVVFGIAVLLVAGCGRTPDENRLVYAAANDDLMELKKIAAKGVSLDSREKGALGQTPLIATTLTQGTNAFFYLLSAGAKVDGGDREGMTALMSAVMLGDANQVKIEALIGAGADVNAHDSKGTSVLTYAKWASAGGHVATNTITLLERHGAK